MLDNLPVPIRLDIAIIFTALSWGIGFYIVSRRVYVFASLAIGAFVCLVGYSVESIGAPPWMIVAAPIPLDILLLWYVLRNLRKMVIAYPLILLVYTGFHVLLSATLRFDSLIPAWKLHG